MSIPSFQLKLHSQSHGIAVTRSESCSGRGQRQTSSPRRVRFGYSERNVSTCRASAGFLPAGRGPRVQNSRDRFQTGGVDRRRQGQKQSPSPSERCASEARSSLSDGRRKAAEPCFWKHGTKGSLQGIFGKTCCCGLYRRIHNLMWVARAWSMAMKADQRQYQAPEGLVFAGIE